MLEQVEWLVLRVRLWFQETEQVAGDAVLVCTAVLLMSRVMWPVLKYGVQRPRRSGGDSGRRRPKPAYFTVGGRRVCVHVGWNDRRGTFSILLHQPPAWFHRSPEGVGCVKYLGNGWYGLDHHSLAGSREQALTAVETLLIQMYERFAAGSVGELSWYGVGTENAQAMRRLNVEGYDIWGRAGFYGAGIGWWASVSVLPSWFNGRIHPIRGTDGWLWLEGGQNSATAEEALAWAERALQPPVNGRAY